MFKIKPEGPPWRPSPRTLVLAVLGAITLGVALLSVSVSYQILVPRFGDWAVPTVAALDALWVVFQGTEILAANNRTRALRAQIAGLVLTVVIAAIPTADLIMTLRRDGAGLDLAVVIAPTAIVFTKIAWWVVLPSLGRGTSAGTRSTIATTRQTVADRLEEMEAKAADRIELLRVASDVQQRVAEAETNYRLAALAAQQTMTAALHAQAEATADTIAAHPLPALVARIDLPALELEEDWALPALALPVTPAVTPVTQVSALPGAGAQTVTPVTLAELAAVTGVPTPEPGEPLTDDQLGVVLRHLRYSEEPPSSYRKAAGEMRRRGFVGSEERIRPMWRALKAQEPRRPDETETEDDAEEADTPR
ncbi:MULTISPECIES: hypothetical protein [unclassified Streptomyces]|uniref:hypothetical protein n=1 Tax=unclassified Streptomyces TaxID=2593676 RepID=UPI0006B03A6D|nr:MULTISPECIES: hypothetical protein [unclassified Streptomyces]KOU78990.1 hypothetical protein ADK93_34920 [Streptomyces sp. XY58]KOV00646.1 hypothetical protein ADK89_33255 [Streptomyces sp. XY37]